jgi:hypothetical protein
MVKELYMYITYTDIDNIYIYILKDGVYNVLAYRPKGSKENVEAVMNSKVSTRRLGNVLFYPCNKTNLMHYLS